MQLLPSRRHLAVLAAVVGLAMWVAPAAHAFTLDDQGNTTANGGARYADPDAKFSDDGSKKTTIRQGNTTLQFGGQTQSFGQRYNSDRMFDPLGRPGEDR